MLIVADTSALLALTACDGLPLLDALFGDVRVPPAVFHECAIPGKPEAERLEDYLRGKVERVEPSDFLISPAGLGRGELEAMALYKRLGADRLLLDDARARKIARLNAIEMVGSVGVLLLAKSEGLIESVRPRLESIRAAGIYLGEGLVSAALRATGEE